MPNLIRMSYDPDEYLDIRISVDMPNLDKFCELVLKVHIYIRMVSDISGHK